MTATVTPAAAPAAPPVPVTPTPMGAQPTANAKPATPQPAPGAPAATAPTAAADKPAPGADSGAAPPPPEPPVETPEQKQQRLSRASRAARRAAAQNRELVARQRMIDGQLQATGQRAQTAEQQVAHLRELAAKDPYAAARALGLDLGRLAQQVTSEGTPEAEMRRQIAEAKEEARQAKERADQWEAQQRASVSEQRRNEAVKAFHAEASDAATFPLVSKMPEAARLAWALQIAAEDRANAQRQLPPHEFARYEPTHRQVLAHMEKLAASASAPKADTASSPAGSPPGSATPTTVSSALSSAKFTLPADFDKMNDAAQKKAMARALEVIVPGAKKKAR